MLLWLWCDVCVVGCFVSWGCGGGCVCGCDG